MKIERAILIAFLGNYLINNVIAAIVALVQGTAPLSPMIILVSTVITTVIAGAVFMYGKQQLGKIADAVFFIVFSPSAVMAFTALVAIIDTYAAKAKGAAPSMNITPQYMGFVVLSSLMVAILTWWFLRRGTAMANWKVGAIFGAIGFLVAIVTAFVSGISGVILQTGSLSQAWGVLPNFWPFLWNWSTLVLLGYWIIPGAAIGWWLGGGMKKPMADVPKPVF